jgi:hypothetical protein
VTGSKTSSHCHPRPCVRVGAVNSIYHADQDFGESVGGITKFGNRNSGQVLGGSATDGADIVQWADVGSLDQQWSLAEVS